MTDRVIGIIQARFASQRLPGKVATQVSGASLLEWICRRVASAGVDNWWVATTDRSDDTVTCQIAERCGVSVFRGSVDDVLSRFVSIIHRERADTVVRLTSDNPFVDAALIDLAISQYTAGLGVVWTTPESLLPVGYSVEIADAELITRSDAAIPVGEDYHRSHVLTWLHQTGHSTPIQRPSTWPARGTWRWTVDTQDDLEMFRSAVALFGKLWPSIDYPAMVGLMDQNSHVPRMNQHIQQKRLEES